MARLLAALRLLWAVTRRDLNSLSSLGLNNLFFCVAFLVQGSHDRETAFLTALPFLLVLFLPMLFAISAGTLEKVPSVRANLWPLSPKERVLLRAAGIALSPAFWLLGGVIVLWAGVAVGLCFIAFAALVQLLVFCAARVTGGESPFRLLTYVPRFPGTLGGVVQVSLRHILSSLDFYTAVMLSVVGTSYRFCAAKPQVDAFPILALLIALTLSTYAQRMFGLESPGSVARYHLLPVAGWRILLAKDVAYLGVLATVALPLGLAPAMTFGLIAIALGRYPSLRQTARQTAWRFTGGDIRFGALQIVFGGLVAMGNMRTSHWFFAVAVGTYVLSLIAGDFWWNRSSSYHR